MVNKIAIACQGGGSHTAFTAGVLKRILKEKKRKSTRLIYPTKKTARLINNVENITRKSAPLIGHTDSKHIKIFSKKTTYIDQDF